jgi:hypothetical protein
VIGRATQSLFVRKRETLSDRGPAAL